MGPILPQTWPSRRSWTSFACAALAAAHAITFVRLGPLDDDYIIYRYARNLSEGHGLVFNLGERVEGFTTPLWTLLCALGIELGIDPAVLSQALGVLAVAVAAFAVAETWRAWWPQSRWPVPALLVALCPSLAYHAAVGLGTTLLAALLALWLWRYGCALRAGRPAASAAAFVGIACLARAEAVLFAVPFLAFELGRLRSRESATAERSRALIGEIALALAPLAAWTVFRAIYFRHGLPITYYAKRLPLSDDLGYGLAYLRDATLGAGVGACACVVLLGLWKGGASLDRAWKAAAIGFLLHTAYVVLVGGDYMPFHRFFVPALPIGLLLATHALYGWIRVRPRACTATAIGAIALMQWTQMRRSELAELYAQLDARWIEIGKTLRNTAAASTSIALEPVGAIGYFSRLPIVDMLGMTNDALWKVDPDVTIPDKGHHRHDVDWVLSQKPDVILVGRGLLMAGTNTVPLFVADRGFFTRDEFRSDYSPFVMDIEQSYPLVFYLRRGSPPPRGARPTQPGATVPR
jgi:hypothetical protein